MNANPVIIEATCIDDEYIEVQPSRALEIIGCSVRTFQEAAVKYKWEKRSIGGREVAYKVPKSFCMRFTPKAIMQEKESALVEFMRDMTNRMRETYGQITELTVEAAQYKLLTDQSKDVHKELQNRLFELEAENKMLKRRRFLGVFPIK